MTTTLIHKVTKLQPFIWPKIILFGLIQVVPNFAPVELTYDLRGEHFVENRKVLFILLLEIFKTPAGTAKNMSRKIEDVSGVPNVSSRKCP